MVLLAQCIVNTNDPILRKLTEELGNILMDSL
ncbi:MAG: hypothetical protein ACJASR_002484 [Psychroserpens sp.]|jgi:hypothetical protein